MGPVATALRITLPYAMPYVFTGTKLAVAYAFIGVIGAEFIMSRTGIGYEIRYAFDNFDNATMYPLILFVLLVAVAVNLGLDRWERRLMARRRARMSRPFGDAAWLIGGLSLAWQIVAWIVGPDALASPARTLVKLTALFGTSVFWGDIAETGEAFVIALAIAIVGGLAIGLLIGLHDFSARVAEPFLLAANSVPKIALYPIVLLIFGIGMPAKIAFGAIHGIVPVAIFTISGCRGVAPVLLKTARVPRHGSGRDDPPHPAAGIAAGDLHRHPHRRFP